MACRDLVLYASLHRITKRAFQSIEFGFLFRTQINFHRGARGIEFIEVPPSMTPKLYELRGSSGTRIEENFTIPRARAVIGFGAPKSDQLCPPGPVMLTSNRRDAIPCVVMCSIDGPSMAITADNRGTKFLYQRAHASKISLAFFADVTGKHDCLHRPNARLRKCARDSNQRRKSRSIVGNAGRFEAARLCASR